MRNRLRVGNLAFAIDLPKFKEIFSEFGTVTNAEIMESPFSGKSRGFGFIEMKSEEEAATCMANLNGREQEGQALLITEAPEEKTRKRVRRLAK